MSKLAKSSLRGKFKNVIFLTPNQLSKFSNLVLKEFDNTMDKQRAFELVEISKDKNLPLALKLEHQFKSKFYPNLQ